ncbi:MAG: 4Fe-4S dicluster domain-containing protein [Bacillota bacterium]
MPQVIFNNDRCKGCELCISVCPKNIIALSKEIINVLGFHPAGVTDISVCTGCSFCSLICPDLAVTVLRKESTKRSVAIPSEE